MTWVVVISHSLFWCLLWSKSDKTFKLQKKKTDLRDFAMSDDAAETAEMNDNIKEKSEKE